ncbi:hypothetical protein QBC36DRAFT_141688 [Triangularia setosa]|uniref:AMP-dependent synthetase/ligase domain-containing protein n=1 Tax=Triangularia setosa TaxID=2587417 RepID=A0AAN6W9H5_9PEZI|nr:hypothetical protein QBC36DRAFT_141688 [Podospora setosa]
MNPTNLITSDMNWAAYLTGVAPCRFPLFSRSAKSETAPKRQPIASTTRVPVEQEDREKLLELSRAADRDGLGAVLRTAWAVLLRCYTGQDDVTFGFQGDTPHPVVARFCLDDAASVSATLEHAKADFAKHLPPVPADLIRSGDHPLFDTSVVLWGLSKSSAPRRVLPLQQQQQDKLRLLVKSAGSNLNLFLEWNTTLLGMPMAQGNLVASTYAKILSALLASPSDAALGTLPILSQANEDQVQSWNNDVVIDPVDRCVHHVIADQVLDRPDAEAICAWDGSLTYRELDAVTGRLAAHLVGLGAGPEVLIPICFEKSVRCILDLSWQPCVKVCS